MRKAMWIVMGIIAAWIYIKRKIKKRDSLKAMPILFMLITSLVVLECNAQKTLNSIQGEITLSSAKGKVYIFLVDEKTFDVPLSGIYTLKIEPVSSILYFRFSKVKKEVYGIRCFQDLNNNGILDRGMFGPTEPYGFSWKSSKKFPLNFSDISFFADKNKFITIKMED